jgi:hypothetical protein
VSRRQRFGSTDKGAGHGCAWLYFSVVLIDLFIRWVVVPVAAVLFVLFVLRLIYALGEGVAAFVSVRRAAADRRSSIARVLDKA